jgi:tetratricopeptide (TPR) repeat protein
MRTELTNSLPKESIAQEIGRAATQCFLANVPASWRVDATDGDNDCGLDFQVQVVSKKQITDIFRVQLKGTKSPTLVEGGSKFSFSLDISTVNYYSRITEPILLVLSDLTANIKPKNCQLYFLWIHEEIRRIREKGVLDNQKSVTFYIPIDNLLDDSLDLSEDIARFRKLSKLGEELDIIIERDRPVLSADQRVELTSKLAPSLALRSASLLDALTEAPVTSWVDAPKGSLQRYLLEATNALQAGNAANAKKALDSATSLLVNAKSLEKADYYHVLGRLHVFTLNDLEAKDAFDHACKLSNDADRHLAPWAEADLRLRFNVDDECNFTSTINRLKSKSPTILCMRARLMAAEGRYDDAIAETQDITGLQRSVAEAIIYIMQAKNEEALIVCEAGLKTPDLPDDTKLLFLILSARSRFSSAIKSALTDKLESYLPMTGPAGADPALLKEAWRNVSEAIPLLRLSGWPGNTELLSDIWTATASMLGLQKETLPLMKEAGAARPSFKGLQAGLESIAGQISNFSLALEANQRQVQTDLVVTRRVALLHLAGRHKDCVDLLESLGDLTSISEPMLGFSISFGIFSADRIIKSTLANIWMKVLESRDEWAPYLAITKYFRALNSNLLAKDLALIELDIQYKQLLNPTTITKQLFYEFDAKDIYQAQRCLDLSEELKKKQLLDIEDCLHLAQALITLGKWDELLSLSDNALLRFENSDRLSAIGALALDKLGRTPDAVLRLHSLIKKSNPDPLALNTYINIASISGFTNEAIKCVESVLERENNVERQIECLRHLFTLIQLSNPSDERLIEISYAIGLKADQSNEFQEGLFLLSIFAATISVDMPFNESMRNDFQKRLAAFTKNFPNSKILKTTSCINGSDSDDLDTESFMKALKDIIGFDEEKIKWRAKIQNELQNGTTPIPYSWRPRYVLDYIPDLPTLWEFSKNSKWTDKHLHLTMATSDWKSVSLAEIRGNTPIFDLISLLIINDLDLFSMLFKIFPRIAIAKATLLELQQLLSPMAGTPFRQKCLDLQNKLKTHFNFIDQPSLELNEEAVSKSTRPSSDEIVEIIKVRNFMVFSDDFLFRIYANPPSKNPKSICTLDFLLAADEAELLTPQIVAKHIATLCSWRVEIAIPVRYQIAILPENLGSVNNINDGINTIRANYLCNSLFSGLWNLGKPFNELQEHAGSLVRELIENQQNSILSISSLAGFWLSKVKFHQNAPTPVTQIIALLTIQAAVYGNTLNQSVSSRLWSIYKGLIELEHGGLMDDNRYRESIRQIATIAADVDFKNKLNSEKSIKSQLSKGLVEGTEDSDLFINQYTLTLVSFANNT